MATKAPDTLRAYLATLQPESRRALTELRDVVEATVPSAERAFSYRIPAYRLNEKPLVWCAGFTHHVGLYPITAGMKRAGGVELAPHLSGKGTARFEIGSPLPKRLVRRILKARVAELSKASA